MLKMGQEKVVCFIDIMGTKNRLQQSDSQTTCNIEISPLIMKHYEDMVNDDLIVSVFADCMYIVADKENIGEMFSFLASLSYTLLINEKQDTEDSIKTIKYKADCLKIRGGITYGKIDILEKDDERYNNKSMELLSGTGMVQAYILESESAVYPRIILDENILKILGNMEKAKKDYCLVENAGFYYFDFLDYLLHKNEKIIIDEMTDILEFVKNELLYALNNGEDKLAGKLLWYQRYLESFLGKLNK